MPGQEPEGRLVDGEQRFRLQFDSISDHAVFTLDVDGHVTDWSNGATQAKGYSADEVVGKHFSIFFTEEDKAEDVPAKSLASARENGRFEAEGWRVKKNGARFYTRVVVHPVRDERGDLIGFSNLTQDITERRQAEMELRASEALYRILADSSSDVISQLDLDFVNRYVSPACAIVLGHAPADLLLRPAAEIVHPDDVERTLSLFSSLVAGEVEGDKTVTTYRVRHKSGDFVWGEVAINLVRDPGSNAPTQIVCSLRDVTERQRAAQHLNEAKIAAEHASRQKAEFLANMSHELRTPLTAILGLHDLLHIDSALSPKQQRYLTMASNAGRSLLGIVNDVLDISKIEAGELAIQNVTFDLGQFTELCYQLALPQANAKSIYCRSHLSGGPVSLIGDPARLQQIVLNMLTNAVKFTTDGGVDLSFAYLDSGTLRVEVRDTGIGIAEDKQPFLFERFAQADASITRVYGGTGLGLAICKRLAELMGGSIGLHSKLGDGTTVWVEVPLAQAPDELPAHTTDADHPNLMKYNVLLAEDNELNQEIISAILEKRGHTVTTVNDGVAAVMAVQSGDAFDVVLMDLQMPVMDGLSAARAIRVSETAHHRKSTPIIGLTANAMVEDVERCRLAGMQAHVAKPIEWNELISAIDRVASQPSALLPEILDLAGLRVSPTTAPTSPYDCLA